MVRVRSLVVNRGSEPVDPVVEPAGERDRDVRRPKGRDHLEACVLEIPNAVDAEDGEPPERSGAEVIDVGVTLRVQSGEAPSVPVRKSTAEPLRLERGIVIEELLASHHDDRIDR